LPFEKRTATTPPALEIVLVSAAWEEPDGFDGACVVVVVLLFDVVVVVDLRVVEEVELFGSDFGLEGLSVVAVVDVGPGSDTAGAVVVVDEAAAAAAAASKVPAVAPGRGSVLAGGAEAGDDAGPAEGLAGAASTGGDGGGSAVSGVGAAGAATSSAAAGTDRAAWRARRTSGRDIGDTPAVEKREETSCTPKSPRSTPVAVPRAHVTTRTRRTGRWCDLPPHRGVKGRLNRRQADPIRPPERPARGAVPPYRSAAGWIKRR
jgi:hypothetical protein